MLRQVYQTVKQYGMISPDDIIVTGVSGGADSVALLLFLCELRTEYNLKIIAVHVNHSIRGEDADEDQRFVEELCRKNGVECKSFRIDVPEYAREHSLSSEEAGRLIRYKLFEEVAEEYGATKIATAHHANDNRETVLHNILRGSGVTGLAGIHPVRGRYIRPLVQTEKSDIVEYLRSQSIEWRTDKTNFEALYTRNKIRLELLPYLRENYNESIDSALTRLSELCREDDDFLRLETEKAFDLCVKQASKNSILLDRAEFVGLHLSLKRRIIRMTLEKLAIPLKDVHLVHIDNAVRMLDGSESGAEQRVGSCRISIIQSGIRFSAEANAEKTREYSYSLDLGQSVFIEATGETLYIEEAEEYRRSDNNTVYIDASTVKLPLTVRNRTAGDRFRPFGMNGTKKLKEFFIDRKIDADRRNLIPLVVSENNIVWITGVALSDNNKITQKTDKILKLHTEK